MLKGRLGLETARVPHADRHGLLWLSRGRLFVVDGTLHFVTKGGDLPAGEFTIPFQTVSFFLLGPGTTISHDALRLLSRHGTGLVAVGEGGVRFYAAMPFGPDDSALARRQVRLWSDPELRIGVVRHMYRIRLGEDLPQRDLNSLRGIEGARAKESYRLVANRFGIQWKRRDYDRQNPQWNDDPNQAINHASTAVQAAAMVASAVAGAVPQLGFIHEDSGVSFCLDIADLFRDEVTLPVAFGAVAAMRKKKGLKLEPTVRKLAGKVFRERSLIPKMIDRIKELLDESDSGGDA